MSTLTFQTYLKENYSQETARVYAGAVVAWELSGLDVVGFVEQNAGREAKVGTAKVIRGALLAWHRWQALDMPALPPGPLAVARAPGKPRIEIDLARYHKKVELCPDPSSRAVLHLIPETGEKVGRLCRIRRKGKEGWRGSRWLLGYLDLLPPGEWLFPSLEDPGKPVHPSTVRNYLRILRGPEKWAPEVLRKVREGPTERGADRSSREADTPPPRDR